MRSLSVASNGSGSVAVSRGIVGRCRELRASLPRSDQRRNCPCIQSEARFRLEIHLVSRPNSLRVFVVENHADTLRFMQRYFQNMGHQVQTAPDMTTALAQLPHADIDLLICDIGLPDGDGWELMTRLGSDHKFLAVAMSGYGDNADKAKSRAAGYRHHLLKPLLPDDLEPILEEA